MISPNRLYRGRWNIPYYPEKADKLVMLSFSPMGDNISFLTMVKMIWYTVFSSKSNYNKMFEWFNNGPLQDKVLQNKMVDIMLETNKYCSPNNKVPTFLSEEDLKNIKNPVLIILGEKDVIYDSLKSHEYCTRVNKSIHFEVIPGSGHMLGVEPHNAEVLDALIVNFLKQQYI